MRNKTIMKIVSICFIFVLIFNMTGSIYAAVNTNYGENTEVVEPDLEAKMQNSALLEAIASLVYGVGSLAESLVGTAFEMLTGSNMFPWADKVIFNTIPFLDVNFLNPAESSLFLTSGGEETVLAGIVRRMYFSVLVLSIGFLGIIVGIMAVRLALSTIAAEKAKYKQAITNFLISLIMLFCVHYIISLVFYINESMVEIASGILTESMSDAEEIDAEFFASEVSDAQLVENFFNAQEGLFSGGIVDEFNKEKDKLLKDDETAAIAAYLLRDTNYKKYQIPEAYGNGETEKTILNRVANHMFWSWGDDKVVVTRLINDVNLAKEIAAKRNDNKKHWLEIEVEKYKKLGAEEYAKVGDVNKSEEKNETIRDWTDLDEYVEWYRQDRINNYGGEMDKTIDQIKEEYETEILPRKMKIYQLIVNSSSASTRYANTNYETIISQMGQYFKENAWTYETDDEGNFEGWDNNELTLQGALLYAIFVFQSILFFVAYIKRFFFVVILAILAPVIVIYDFLGKAIM